MTDNPQFHVNFFSTSTSKTEVRPSVWVMKKFQNSRIPTKKRVCVNNITGGGAVHWQLARGSGNFTSGWWGGV